MDMEIKRLEFVESGLSVVGVNDQPILVAGTDVVKQVANALVQALPKARLLEGQIWWDEIEGLLGIAVVPLALSDSGVMETAWQDWFETVEAAVLLELFELKYGASNDPFYVNDVPNPAELYFASYVRSELTAQELMQELMGHPEVMLTGTLLRSDVEAVLKRAGVPNGDGVMTQVQQHVREMFGTSEGFRETLLGFVEDWVRSSLVVEQPAWS